MKGLDRIGQLVVAVLQRKDLGGYQDDMKGLHNMHNDPRKSFQVVSKWGINFDGNNSVTNFVERVEELRKVVLTSLTC